MYIGVCSNTFSRKVFYTEIANKKPFKKESSKIMSRHKHNKQYKYNPSYKKLMANCNKEKEKLFYEIPF